MRWKDYEAAVANARFNGKAMPSLTECVLQVFDSVPVSSRTEIVHRVHILTGIDTYEVHYNISNLLSAMEKANLIRHTGHNEWRVA